MKITVTALLIGLAATAAHAQYLPDIQRGMVADGTMTREKFQRCSLEGQVYGAAARARDNNESPQQAFNESVGYARADGIPDGFVKSAVNLLYFQDGFTHARGRALIDQITSICLDPDGKYSPHYQPLQ